MLRPPSPSGKYAAMGESWGHTNTCTGVAGVALLEGPGYLNYGLCLSEAGAGWNGETPCLEAMELLMV